MKKKAWGIDAGVDYSQMILFSPDGKLFVTPASRTQLAIWDTSHLKRLDLIPVAPSLFKVFQFSPDGKVLAVGEAGQNGETDVISLWDLSTRKRIRTVRWECPADLLTSAPGSTILAFSPNGRHLAWAGQDHRIHMVEVATGSECQMTRSPHGPLRGLAFSPDGCTLALGSRECTVYLWDPTSLHLVERFAGDHPGSLEVLAFSPDGRTLALGGAVPYLCDATTGKLTALMDVAREGAFAARAGFLPSRTGVFSASGRYLICGCWDGTVRFWDTKSGKEVRRFRAFDSVVKAIALSPDGRYLAAGGADPSVFVWDLKTGKDYSCLRGHQKAVRTLAFSPDGSSLAAGGEDKVIRIWEMASGKPCLQLNSGDILNCLAFSGDGRFLASSGADKVVSIWELATRDHVARLIGHQGEVTYLCFSPNGKVLATASEDTTALLWCWRAAISSRTKLSDHLSLDDLRRYWRELGSSDANIAYRALWALAAAPEDSLPLIRKHLHPVLAPDVQRIAHLIAELESHDFNAREEAMRALTILDDLAEPSLRKGVENAASAEGRRRIQALLNRLYGPVADQMTLRRLRALVVLEKCGASEGVALLRRLAEGEPEARLTRMARSLLTRSDQLRGKP